MDRHSIMTIDKIWKFDYFRDYDHHNPFIQITQRDIEKKEALKSAKILANLFEEEYEVRLVHVYEMIPDNNKDDVLVAQMVKGFEIEIYDNS